MIKTEKGSISFEGDKFELMTDFCFITHCLYKDVFQKGEGMTPEEAEEKILENINIALMPDVDLKKKVEDMKRQILGEVLDAMKDISKVLCEDHGENAEKQEGGACDGCGGKGSCRCGTDEADS